MADKQVSFDKHKKKGKRGSQYLNADVESVNIDQ